MIRNDTIEEIAVNEPTLCEYSIFDEDLKCAVEDQGEICERVL